METKRLTLIALFSALTVTLGYAFLFVPNLELVSATVFIAGYLLGPAAGALVGVVGEGIYSALNPMGSGLGLPQLLVAQVLSLALFGVAGGIVGRLRRGAFGRRDTLLFAAIGVVLTAAFDLVTTLAFPLAAGFSQEQIVATLAVGFAFNLFHIATNAMIFALVVPAVLRALSRHGHFA